MQESTLRTMETVLQATAPGSSQIRVFQLWNHLSPSSRRLILASLGLLMVMVAAVGLMMLQLRSAADRDLRRNIGRLGMAVAEQTDRSIQAVDVQLQELRDEIASVGITAPEQFARALHNPALEATLKQEVAALPQARSIDIIGADGNAVNSSRPAPEETAGFADRECFRYFQANIDQTTCVGRTVREPDGRLTLPVARRVGALNGRFLGIVLARMDLRYFQDFYHQLTTGTGNTVTLLSRDGTPLTGFPAALPGWTEAAAEPAWHSLVARHVPGSFLSADSAGDGPQIVSVHPLQEYPLVVDISIGQREALADWREAATLAAIGTACAVLCVLMLVRALMFQLRRLEDSEASLAEQNGHLDRSRRFAEKQAIELQISREQLARKSNLLETTLDHMNQGILLVDADGSVPVCNRRVAEMMEMPYEFLSSRPGFADIVATQHSMGEFGACTAADMDAYSALPDRPTSYERRRPNGVVLDVQSVPLPGGGMVRTYTDITRRRESEEQVRYFAHHDDLTKLVNRVVFRKQLEYAIELADRSHRAVAVLYIDLDLFKSVNDTRGHAAGDELLVQVAARLRGAVRDIDTVARMGGDEFAVIQPLAEQPQSSAGLARRLLDLIARPFEIDGRHCLIGASVGIAFYPDQAMNAADLLRHADIALYRAKAEGRGTYIFFEPEMDAANRRRLTLDSDLARALQHREFELEYQPIAAIGDRRPVCFEALVRWRHPTLGLIMPAEFIGSAEKSGAIVPIGLWVIETACRAATQFPGGESVAVNLSPVQFNDPGIAGELTAILERTGLSPRRLVIEVTEGVLLQDSKLVLDSMQALRSLGVRFSLDDFGTAHAGLSYLRRFTFDIIKIDRSFVRDVADQPEARAVVAAVLTMASAMNLGVIAEGVETEAQLSVLRSLNCGLVQGYLTGRPRPA